MRKALLVLFLSFHGVLIYAQKAYINEYEGLSHRHVTCVLQDHTGLIWVGTANGLNVYDGYSFKNYFTFTQEIRLSNARINCLVEDGMGNLWVGTNAGLNKISANRSSSRSIDGLKDSGIVSLLVLVSGDILIGTTVGEILAVHPTDEFETLFKDGREIAINGLAVDHNGTPWFFTNSERKAYYLDHSYQPAQKFSGLISSNFLLMGDSMLAAFQDKSGITILNTSHGNVLANTFLDSVNKIHGQTNLLYRDKRRTIWAAYPGGVLLNLDLEKKNITDYSSYFKRAYFGSAPFFPELR